MEGREEVPVSTSCAVAQARAELTVAERDGDLARAGELTHAVLPRLTKELEQVCLVTMRTVT